MNGRTFFDFLNDLFVAHGKWLFPTLIFALLMLVAWAHYQTVPGAAVEVLGYTLYKKRTDLIEPSTAISSDKGSIEQNVGNKNKIAVDAGGEPREEKQELSNGSSSEKSKNKGSSRIDVELSKADQDSLLKVDKVSKSVTNAFHCLDRIVNAFDDACSHSIDKVVQDVFFPVIQHV